MDLPSILCLFPGRPSDHQRRKDRQWWPVVLCRRLCRGRDHKVKKFSFSVMYSHKKDILLLVLHTQQNKFTNSLKKNYFHHLKRNKTPSRPKQTFVLQFVCLTVSSMKHLVFGSFLHNNAVIFLYSFMVSFWIQSQLQIFKEIGFFSFHFVYFWAKPPSLLLVFLLMVILSLCLISFLSVV